MATTKRNSGKKASKKKASKKKASKKKASKKKATKKKATKKKATKKKATKKLGKSRGASTTDNEAPEAAVMLAEPSIRIESRQDDASAFAELFASTTVDEASTEDGLADSRFEVDARDAEGFLPLEIDTDPFPNVQTTSVKGSSRSALFTGMWQRFKQFLAAS